MNSYDFLAGCYDEFTTDVGYSAWADYIEAHFRRRGLPGKTVLDLACGTGSLTRELAQRGYEMIGVDLSPEMLAEAAETNQDVDGIPPIFLCQSMDKLNLYGTIDACVCCLDSVNYVTDPKKLQKAFERIYLFLMPGGVFLFDINTPEKLRGLDGQVFLDETEDAYCVWRGGNGGGAPTTPSAAASAPTLWTFSVWMRRVACGSVAKSCTGSGPMSPRSWWNISLRRAFRTSVSTAT